MANQEHAIDTPFVPGPLNPEQQDLVRALWTRPLGLAEQERESMRGSITKAFDTAPASDLGLLHVFALETLTVIINELDLESCMRLRQVNRHARQMVTNAPKYRLVADNAVCFLEHTLRSKLGSWRTLEDVGQLLRQRCCSCCNNLGNIADPLRWKKLCAHCFSLEDVRNKCISRARASQAVGMSANRLRKLVPVLDSRGSVYQRKAQYVVTVAAVRQLCTNIKLNRPMDWFHAELDHAPKMAVEADYLPYVDEKGCVDWGGRCLGGRVDGPCVGSFTAQAFHDHIGRCRFARRKRKTLNKLAAPLELEDGWIWIR